MAESQPLIAAIRGGEKTKQAALRTIYTDSGYRKTAWRAYQRCAAGRQLLEWEDFFCEAILRFVEAVDRGSKIRSGKAFFFGICRNYCTELTRKSRRPELRPSAADLPIDDLVARVAEYIDRMRKQCRILLQLIYFNEPPVDPRDREKIVAELQQHGYELKTSSVSATITNCKAELRRLIGRDLDDYLVP